jgi:hypothetical protein
MYNILINGGMTTMSTSTRDTSYIFSKLGMIYVDSLPPPPFFFQKQFVDVAEST